MKGDLLQDVVHSFPSQAWMRVKGLCYGGADITLYHVDSQPKSYGTFNTINYIVPSGILWHTHFRQEFCLCKQHLIPTAEPNSNYFWKYRNSSKAG